MSKWWLITCRARANGCCDLFASRAEKSVFVVSQYLRGGREYRGRWKHHIEEVTFCPESIQSWNDSGHVRDDIETLGLER